MKRILYIICMLGIGITNSKGSHIVGAQMYYDHQGGNTYKIYFSEYRNCTDTCFECAPYTPVYIQIFDTAGHYIDSVLIQIPPSDTLPIADSVHCWPRLDYCVEVATFQATVNLPYMPGGYILVYQRCCRNSSLTNIMPGTGATYFTIIPDSMTISGSNSSPRFIGVVPQISPIDTPFTFNMTATDPDNDSLVYRITNSYDGASSACPDPSPAGAFAGCPTVAPPPPYASVTYISPYNVSNLTNNPPDSGYLRIDPHTGVLSGKVNQSGVFLVAVAADEYRQGQYIGSTLFDFQFTFTACVRVTEVKATEMNSTKIYAEGPRATIQFDKNENQVQISFFNLLGQEISNETINGSFYQKTFSTTTPQYLIVKVQLSNGETIYKKLLIDSGR